MIKEYIIENDKDCYIIEGRNKVKKNLTIQQKLQQILSGKVQLMKQTDYYRIYKVLRAYELKLVAVIKCTETKFKIYESICPEPNKNEYLKLIINFNNQLHKEGIQIGINFEKLKRVN